MTRPLDDDELRVLRATRFAGDKEAEAAYEESCAYWESLTFDQVHGPVEDLPPMPESMRQPQHRPREAAR